MSTLQCPATLLLAPPAAAGADGLTVEGRRQARALAESLRGARVARIYCGAVVPAVQTAEVAAAVLDVHVEVREGLRERSAGEDDAALLARTADELGAVADQHPGETVLVVGDGGALGDVLPRLAANLPAGYARTRPLAPATVVEAAVDADGWQVRTWAGSPLMPGSSENA